MKYNPEIHHRRSIRIPGYDYAQSGAYFITCVTHARECMLGKVQDGLMTLSPFGKIVQYTWRDLPPHYPYLELDSFCIMPNHVHAIFVIVGDTDPTRRPLSEIVRAFKSFSARRINLIRHTAGHPVWQRNYYEHIIRDHPEYISITNYILDNHLNWEKDEEYQ